MTLVTCMNGHRYDADITSECPECAMQKGNTIPLITPNEIVMEDYGGTIPLNPPEIMMPNGQSGATVPLTNPTEPEDYGATMPLMKVDEQGFNTSVKRPLSGWLVCIDGPEKGMDYRLHDEYNYIGRSATNDVCIAGDNAISRERHAVIAYDSRDKAFFFAPMTGGSIVRLNGRAVLTNMVLTRGDKIEIGKSTLLFVPLCGDDFEW